MSGHDDAEGVTPRAVRDSFLELYVADLEADVTRGLVDYQRRFSGHEDEIAAEWRLLEVGGAAEHGGGRAEGERRLGPYRILRVLGQGAQATVYLAEHEQLRRRVALKVLRDTWLDAPGAAGESPQRRFEREAELTASLDHSGICSIYETGRDDGRTWIAMQFVDGETLAARLADRRASAGAASSSSSRTHQRQDLEFIEAVARALHVAHERGLVHRDVKPGNLMVAAEDGRPVVLDFGLARDAGSEALGLTRTADVLGTPYYLAPEQLQTGASAIDRRVDVWALGVTLHECLTGERPFRGASRDVLYRQILEAEPVPLREVVSGASRDLEVVLATALEKDLGRRYATALEFAEDLRRVREHEPILARRVSVAGRVWRWARRHPGVAVSSAATALAVVLGLIVSVTALGRAQDALVREQNALRSARDALQREKAARLASYDLLSRGVARDEVRGQVALERRQLEDLALQILDTQVPGLRAELDRLARAWNSTVEKKEAERARGEVVAEAVADLDALGRLAAADLLYRWAEPTLLHGEPPFEEWDRVGLGMARAVLSALDLAAVDDPRVLRARLLVADVLIRLGELEAATQSLEGWLARDAASDLPGDVRREAAYRVRLAVARHAHAPAPEHLSNAREQLRLVAEEYPGNWISHDGYALLIQRHDQIGNESAAAELRQELGDLILDCEGMMGGPTVCSRHVWFTMVEPERVELIEFVIRVNRRTAMEDLDPAQVEELLAEEAQIRSELRIEPGEFLNHFLATLMDAACNNQGNRVGWERDSVRRLAQRAVDLSGHFPQHRLSGHSGKSLLAMHHVARGTPADLERAEALYREAIAVCATEAARGFHYGDLGDVLRRQAGEAQLAEAEARLLESYEWRRALRGETEPVTTNVAGWLVALYERLGRREDAARWRVLAEAR